MVIDASALIAILFDEPEAQRFSRLIVTDSHRRMSAANLLEAAIRADHAPNPQLGQALDDLVAELELRVEPVTLAEVGLAREAYRRYGRGNHPARLNFGDCFAYALAKSRGEPLLFKGDDFSRTDLPGAMQ
jgi:ribonuclease VapC